MLAVNLGRPLGYCIFSLIGFKRLIFRNIFRGSKGLPSNDSSPFVGEGRAGGRGGLEERDDYCGAPCLPIECARYRDLCKQGYPRIYPKIL